MQKYDKIHNVKRISVYIFNTRFINLSHRQSCSESLYSYMHTIIYNIYSINLLIFFECVLLKFFKKLSQKKYINRTNIYP